MSNLVGILVLLISIHSWADSNCLTEMQCTSQGNLCHEAGMAAVDSNGKYYSCFSAIAPEQYSSLFPTSSNQIFGRCSPVVSDMDGMAYPRVKQRFVKKSDCEKQTNSTCQISQLATAVVDRDSNQRALYRCYEPPQDLDPSKKISVDYSSYQPHVILAHTKVPAGGFDGITRESIPVDSISCQAGSVRLVHNGQACSNGIVMNKDLHTSFFPRVYACVRRAIKDLPADSVIKVENFGVYNNRLVRGGGSLSGHAFARSIDFAGLIIQGKSYTLLNSARQLDRVFLDYFKSQLPSGTVEVTERQYAELRARFITSAEFLASDYGKLWAPFFECYNFYEINGVTLGYGSGPFMPELDISTNGTRLLRISPPRDITLAHIDHSCISMSSDESD